MEEGTEGGRRSAQKCKDTIFVFKHNIKFMIIRGADLNVFTERYISKLCIFTDMFTIHIASTNTEINKQGVLI